MACSTGVVAGSWSSPLKCYLWGGTHSSSSMELFLNSCSTLCSSSPTICTHETRTSAHMPCQAFNQGHGEQCTMRGLFAMQTWLPSRLSRSLRSSSMDTPTTMYILSPIVTDTSLSPSCTSHQTIDLSDQIRRHPLFDLSTISPALPPMDMSQLASCPQPGQCMPVQLKWSAADGGEKGMPTCMTALAEAGPSRSLSTMIQFLFPSSVLVGSTTARRVWRQTTHMPLSSQREEGRITTIPAL